MTSSEIQSNLIFIRSVLDEKVANGDPNGALEKLNKLTNIMGLSAECYAKAERIYNIKLGELVREYAKDSMNTTDKKLLFQGKLANEIELMTTAQEYSKKVDKTIEALRSAISYYKQEMSKFLP